MVADERLTKYRLCSAWEPTGTALVVNSWTTARRIACFLFSMIFSTLPAPGARRAQLPECSLQYRERDLVVQVHAAAGGHDAAADPRDQAAGRQLVPLRVGGGGGSHPILCTQAQHQRFGRRFARLQVFPIRLRLRA